ncbi:MAG: hypothetical protein K0S29_912 [Gammaproteobacteria bacterium]|jgi:hypothetical protein|nr:hypothetical protein [Gammaproteobacteria bacterium]
MKQPIDERLQHLSKAELERLIYDYTISKMKVKKICEKYRIQNVRLSHFFYILPHKLADHPCRHCGSEMYTTYESRSGSRGGKTYCGNCEHIESDCSCRCEPCKANRQARLQLQYEEMRANNLKAREFSNDKRALIREMYAVKSMEPGLPYYLLSFEQALALLSFYYLSNQLEYENLNVFPPLNECSEFIRLAPSVGSVERMIDILTSAGLIAVNPESNLDAFVVENNQLTSSYYLYRVSWIPTLGNDGDEASEYIEDLQNLARNHPWPFRWYDEAGEMWQELSLGECSEILEYYANKFNLSAPLGEKTRMLFKELLHDFSVGQVQAIVYKAVRDAAAYKTQKKYLSSGHAGNLIALICRQYVQKIKANEWPVETYNRSNVCPRTAMSHVLHDIFLGHGEKEHGIIYQAITPAYFGGGLSDDVIDLGVEPVTIKDDSLEKESAVSKTLSIKEVAVRLNKPRSTIASWCKRGVFPNAKLVSGVMWQIPEPDLLDYEARLKPPGRPSRSNEIA